MEKMTSKEIGSVDNTLTPDSIKMLRKLAGGIAHDYNNILTVILGNLTLARSYSNLDSEILEIIIDVEKATQKAKEITESLIDFSKSRLLEFRPGDIHAILSRLCNKLFTSESALIEYQITADLWPVTFDHHSLTLAFRHIFRFIKSESNTHKDLIIVIANCLREQRKWMEIRITDSNLVLLNDRMTTLFTPHFSIIKEDFGIGLIAAYSLILKHSGSFTISSEAFRGTSFIIHLPVE